MPAQSFETIQELELNAWPDLLNIQRDGWRVRLAAGFTGRANSTTALIRNAQLSDGDLTEIEAIYARHGLATQVRITELVAPEFEARLAERGYQIKNASEFQSVRLDKTFDRDPLVQVGDRPSIDWIESFGRLTGRTDFKTETMAAILGRILLPVGFAQFVEGGAVRAVGMGVVDRGLMEIQSIAVDASFRQRGLGRRIVSSLLAWGQDAGAGEAILSVAATNAPAIRLYSSLGFTRFGGYHYRVKAL
jgi:ribosomal protein S18 acetylase RimI-like enzyme